MNSVRSRKAWDRWVLLMAWPVFVILAVGTHVHAASFEWSNGGGDWLWNNSANWTNSAVPTSGIDSLVFGSVGAGTVTNDIGAFSFTDNGMTFESDYTVSGDYQLVLDGWNGAGNTSFITLDEAGGSDLTVSISSPVVFDNNTVTVPDGSLLVFTGALAGPTKGAVVQGGGTVRFSCPSSTFEKWVAVGATTTVEFTEGTFLNTGFLTFGAWNGDSEDRTLAYVGSGNGTLSTGTLSFNGGGNGTTVIIANRSPDHGDMTVDSTFMFNDKDSAQTHYLRFTGSSTGITTVNSKIRDFTNGGSPDAAAGAAASVILDSPGSLRLTATNTYTGTTTIDDGILLVNGTTSSNGSYTVNSEGTLGGTGTVSGATTVLAGGRLSPGDGGAGTVTFTNTLDISGLATNDSGDLQFDLGDTSDKIILTSQALTIGSDELGASDFTFTGSISEDIVLIETAQSISGTLDPDDLRAAGGEIIAISDDGTDIVLLGAPPAGTVICIQ